MKKNVLFWVGVKSDNPVVLEKHGNFDYFEYSKKTWKYWCEKNDVVFYEYSSTNYDTSKHKINWTRWFDVFDRIDGLNIEYDKIALIDGSTMIKWDAPNFFNENNSHISAFKSLENIRWIMQGIDGYSDLFDNFKFDYKKYVSCGFQIFDKTHRDFLNQLKDFYFKNYDIILHLEKTIKRGTDQPVYNYLLQINDVDVNTSLPNSFWLMHMNRFGWFNHNWQFGYDKTPYFIKYGYIWVFSGFDRRQRTSLMKQTWDIVKSNYE